MSGPESRPAKRVQFDPAKRVQFFYWSECPSWERALGELREEMASAGVDEGELLVSEVAEEGTAQELGFPGSPTIRIDGSDVEETADAPIGLSCRVYRRADGRVSPLPDRERIAAALQALN